jgi:hypothetical protein
VKPFQKALQGMDFRLHAASLMLDGTWLAFVI